MGIVIGIDVGISTTKIVGIDDNGKVVSPIRIRATDPVTSLYGAFGKYLHDNHIQLNEVEKVMLTGVGSAYINEPVYGLPTEKAEEFVADGLGARYETKLDRMLVVSLGTGTSIVKCDGDDIKHIGGTASEAALFRDSRACCSRLTTSSRWQHWRKKATFRTSTCLSRTSAPIRCRVYP